MNEDRPVAQGVCCQGYDSRPKRGNSAVIPLSRRAREADQSKMRYGIIDAGKDAELSSNIVCKLALE